jgi:hypothetical protein
MGLRARRRVDVSIVLNVSGVSGVAMAIFVGVSVGTFGTGHGGSLFGEAMGDASDSCNNQVAIPEEKRAAQAPPPPIIPSPAPTVRRASEL